VNGLSRWRLQIIALSWTGLFLIADHSTFQEAQTERVRRLSASGLVGASEFVRVRIVRILVQELLVARSESATNVVKISISTAGEKVTLGGWVPGITRLHVHRVEREGFMSDIDEVVRINNGESEMLD